MQRESPTGEAHDSSSLSSLTVCALPDGWVLAIIARRFYRLGVVSVVEINDYTHHRRRSQPHAVKHRYEGIKGRGEGKDREGGRTEEAEEIKRFRVPRVYLRSAFLAILANQAIRKINNLRVLNTRGRSESRRPSH